MGPGTRQRAARAAPCAVAFDDATRQLYATDASLYRVEPAGVAFPRTASEAAAAIGLAVSSGWAVLPRGAGTGLAGGALGDGLVIDLARHNRGITAFNPEARTVRVGAGVVLDQLNAHLRPHGLCFGPDVATSSRATLGGMIGNNSSGARAPVHGTTIDHVRSVELVLGDGRVVEAGPEQGGIAEERRRIDALIRACGGTIARRLHPGVIKRWPGYGVDRYLRAGGDFVKVIGGSEGTLAAVFSAELSLVPLPREKGVGLLFFDSVAEAMQASVEILDLAPAAIEHIDDVLFDQTRGQLAFRAARALLDLDGRPCKSILLVEFYEDAEEKLAALMGRGLGTRRQRCANAAEMALVWNLRKAGLSLLTGCKGAAKPAPGIEDVAVPPARLPDYVAALSGLFERLGLSGSFYGHAASGLLHVRPVVDMHRAEDIATFRQVAEEVAAIARQFDGSLAAEHGVGIARTEFMPEHLGPELMELMRGIKGVLDPGGVMNPGKIIPDGRYRFDAPLRLGPGTALESLPFAPALRFAAKDEGFAGNLEQCNGCGGCRKDAATMCPTYQATGEESMSTRGRANLIRAAVDGRFGDYGGAASRAALDTALTYCLSCKACTVECPSNVNMALLKAELLHARHEADGTPLSAMLLSRVDLLGALASRAPRIANALLGSAPGRWLASRALGLAADRPLPAYASERFDDWFRARGGAGAGSRGTVLLWDDTFTRHHEPGVGRAAVRVLEALGHTVALPAGRKCCGRPAFSLGRLSVARELGRANLRLLAGGEVPIVFLEPSCFSMFIEDYRELDLPDAAAVAARCVLFEDFVEGALASHAGGPLFPGVADAALHAHCHAKATVGTGAMARLAARVAPGRARVLDTGCCGMAGAFGARSETQAVSAAVAAPLLEQIAGLGAGVSVVASGTSCRHQVEHLAGVRALHAAEWLAAGLAGDTGQP